MNSLDIAIDKLIRKKFGGLENARKINKIAAFLDGMKTSIFEASKRQKLELLKLLSDN